MMRCLKDNFVSALLVKNRQLSEIKCALRFGIPYDSKCSEWQFDGLVAQQRFFHRGENGVDHLARLTILKAESDEIQDKAMPKTFPFASPVRLVLPFAD